MTLLEQQDRAPGELRQAAAGAGALVGLQQTRRPEFLEPLLPGEEGVLGEADQRGEIAGGQAAPDPAVEDEEALLRVVSWGLNLIGPSQNGPAPAAGQPRCHEVRQIERAAWGIGKMIVGTIREGGIAAAASLEFRAARHVGGDGPGLQFLSFGAAPRIERILRSGRARLL